MYAYGYVYVYTVFQNAGCFMSRVSDQETGETLPTSEATLG